MSSLSQIINDPIQVINQATAPIQSPTFTGTVTVPTPTTGDNSSKLATTAFVRNSISALEYYYKEPQVYQSAALAQSHSTSMVFDASGNLYWSVLNYANASTSIMTSYIIKITPNGTSSQFASATTYGAQRSALAVDASGNIFWALTNSFNSSAPTGALFNYVYKITPAGTQTTFATTPALNTAADVALTIDTSGNIYWALSVSGAQQTSFTQTSLLYKMAPGFSGGGTPTLYQSVTSYCAYGTGLAFDTAGNLYWSMMNNYNGTTYFLTSYVYKITPAGTMTTFASVPTNGAEDGSLVMGADGNLYWAVCNVGNYTSILTGLTSYVYKITPAGALTTFASVQLNQAFGGKLAFDALGNLYWSLSVNASTGYDMIYKITSSGVVTTIASIPETVSAGGHSIIFDSAGNLYRSQSSAVSNTTTAYIYRLDKQQY